MGKNRKKATKQLDKNAEIEKIAHSLMGFKERTKSKNILGKNKQKMPYHMYCGMKDKAMKKMNKEDEEQRKLSTFGDTSRKYRLMEGIFIKNAREERELKKKKRERMRIRRSKATGILTLPKSLLNDD
ncbi:unnamed protein product [Moneuplotes crassus]|uniref:Uncharacterized protein n=2 Tax=Euplotes crassus TaxID=5936 RepID=A0AAD1Y3H8_EUPCR|nr:unnamed protein product [Moneuplotes crassus]